MTVFDFFVSHSHHDTDTVKEMVTRIESWDLQCYLDVNVRRSGPAGHFGPRSMAHPARTDPSACKPSSGAICALTLSNPVLI